MLKTPTPTAKATVATLIVVLLVKYKCTFLSATSSLVFPRSSIGIPKDWAKFNELDGTVLVTGALGWTGSFIYHELKQRDVFNVRAFVRDVEKAKTELLLTILKAYTLVI